MTGLRRLTTLESLNRPNVVVPAYQPEQHGIGILHLGLGAFHRAHQAVYTDTALALDGGDWRIVGASLRGTQVSDALNPQAGLYSVLERGPEGSTARVVASIERAISLRENANGIRDLLCDERIRIVTLTVTEKAYGIDRTAGMVDIAHPAIAHDLEQHDAPIGAIGLLVFGLRCRRQVDMAPYTILCCDNLPANGELLRLGVLDFARRLDRTLADWIADRVAFPSSMVDRITPASTQTTRDDAAGLLGCEDQAAIEAEPFSQWVLEDRFPTGRPAWERAGAVFVERVAPYEKMKLRMLNGAHSMLAYAGLLCGCDHVRDVMQHDDLAPLVKRHMEAAAQTLERLPSMNTEQYRDDLLQRFANPAIAHSTWQIAMDGSQKLPQRLLEPASHALAFEQDLQPFAFAVACWMRYCLGRLDDQTQYALQDPRDTELRHAMSESDSAERMVRKVMALPDLFPEELAGSRQWTAALTDALDALLMRGVVAAVAAERISAGAGGSQ